MKRLAQQAFMLACFGALACRTLQALGQLSRALAEFLDQPAWAPDAAGPGAPVGVFPSEQPMAMEFANATGPEGATSPRTVVLDLDTRCGPRTSMLTLQVLDQWWDEEYPHPRAVKG
jgi:hypothetical protein